MASVLKNLWLNKKVLIMGLGLNPKGSGVSAAKFFSLAWAKVTVTDLKTEKELAQSLKLLKNFSTCHAEAAPKPKAKAGRRRIRFVLGRHNESDFKNADLVIKNPGVRQTSKYLQIAKENNVPIETDIGIFLKNCPAQIIGVTGTRGKSTTVALIGEMLKTKNPPSSRRRSGLRRGEAVFVGGNIQMSPLNFLNQIKKNSKVVLELSSWMLEDARHPYYESTKFGEITKNEIDGFYISVLTNLMPDHLNTYKNFGDYIKAKALIFKNQTKNDFAVLNHDDSNVRKLVKRIKSHKVWFSRRKKINGAFVKNNKIFWNYKSDRFPRPPKSVGEKIGSLKDIALPGEHNILNILAAVAVAKLEGVSNRAIQKVLKTFKGLPNRLEFIREIRGIKFYNDTTSTMPQATMCALRTLSQIRNPKSLFEPSARRAEKAEIPPNPPLSKGGKGGFIQNPKSNIILIAGGSDKKLDYKKLGQEIKKYCKAVVLFEGEASDKLLKEFSIFNFSPCGRSPGGGQFSIVRNIVSMKEAVKNAVKLAKKGDIILLSPAAASFGLFQNEFDRGEQFVKEIRQLK